MGRGVSAARTANPSQIKRSLTSLFIGPQKT